MLRKITINVNAAPNKPAEILNCYHTNVWLSALYETDPKNNNGEIQARVMDHMYDTVDL